ncbi:MAG: carboxypeptidase regulatory-like domain-containing protein, partial [Opitutaceae bacterium]
MTPRRLPLIRLFLALIIAPLAAPAQSAGTGTVTGRVLNPASGEFVRYARISVEGTALQAVSGEGGVYVLTEVPAGPARVVISYTGYRAESAVVNVPAGGAVTRDFELVSTLSAAGPETVKLQQFV